MKHRPASGGSAPALKYAALAIACGAALGASGWSTRAQAMAASGTTKASAGIRSMRPANSALAATGMKPGTCGRSRAVVSNATRKATRARSIQRSVRPLFGCIIGILRLSAS